MTKNMSEFKKIIIINKIKQVSNLDLKSWKKSGNENKNENENMYQTSPNYLLS